MRTKHSAALEEPADSRRGQLVRPVVALVIVFTLAAVAQSELRGREQRARHTELELTWIRSRASLVALHEDRAVDDAFLSSGIDLRIDALDRDIDGAVDRLPRDGHVAAVKGALRSFRAAVREAVGLVKAGEIRQARLLDSEKVDLWYEELNR